MAVLHFPKTNANHNREEAKKEVISSAEFQVMFQLREPTEQPWGNVFRGRYTLPAILEILAGFEKSGVRLRVIFLEDSIGSSEMRSIREAFAGIGRDHPDWWIPSFNVCPMMFAAADGLDRSVGALMDPKHFICNPDQIVNGNISAMGYALMNGWRPDIAVQLIVAGASAKSIEAALSWLAAHRSYHSDDPDLYQRECRDAVIDILQKELSSLA